MYSSKITSIREWGCLRQVGGEICIEVNGEKACLNRALEGCTSITCWEHVCTYENNPNLIMAASFIVLIIPLTIFFFSQKIFLSGIVVSGAEK